MRRLQLSPSILTADFGRLAEEIASVDEFVDWYHLDVMDGHYVDNLTFGPSTVEAIAKVTQRPLHVHLMITDPVKYAPAFATAGAARISFHPEVTADSEAAVEAIAETGVGVGLAIHPDVPVSVAEPHLDQIGVVLMMTVRPGFGGQSFLDEAAPKISEAVALLQKRGRSADIDVEVDGGVNLSTLDRAVGAGADIIVAGSAVFDGVDAPAAAQRLRQRLDAIGKG
ncbi:MAG TPA: ribulose-phosphate 3-epimerase [Actinomycetota bacterium]|nr:ribulose-phosphate 3-epimerase [Actinomycetota bacterium]